MTSVTIEQITSTNRPWNAFLNVLEREGSVEVWGNSYEQPTYLLVSKLSGKDTFNLICFDNEEYAKEWLELNKEEWETILDLTHRTA